MSFLELSYDLAALTLREIASIHATGYHFLQNYQGGVSGFLKDQPEFNYSGWVADEKNTESKHMTEMFTGIALGLVTILKEYGEDPELVERMEKFIPNLGLVVSEKTASKSHYKFQTINHNDLHMSNVMFKYVFNFCGDDSWGNSKWSI